MSRFLLLLIAVPSLAADAPPPALTAKAKALVAALAKSDFAAAGKDFDATMRKAMPKDKLETAWKSLLGQVGAFQRQTGVRGEKVDKYQVVTVSCQFEKSPLDVRIVFDADERVAGLFFRPTKPPPYHAPDYVKRDAFQEKELQVGSGEWALPGTLSLPKGEGPFPAVILIQGSGPHDRDETIGPNRPFRDLAWGLASRGIAVLRYEKRTKEHAAKVKKQKGITVREEVIDDALAAAKLLRKTPGIDPKKVFILGHSLGGTLAPRIGEFDPSLAGLIILAGTTRPLEDLILEQMTYLASLGDVPKDMVERIKAQVARVKSPKLSETPAADLPLGVPAGYWLSLREADPLKAVVRTKQPVLILQGERDYQVTMTDFAGWKKALAGRKNVELKSYPTLNHLFVQGTGKSKPSEYQTEGHVAPEVIQDIAGWVKKQ